MEVIQARELTPELMSRWNELRHGCRSFESPYFQPEFTLTAAGVWADTLVGILTDGGQAVGFFPFQRHRFGIAGPVGGRLSDYQGIIVSPHAEWDAADLVDKCGLTIYDFDHMIAEQEPFARFHTRRVGSPTIDLSDGYGAYREAKRRCGSSRFQQMERKARKLEREMGPVRCVFQARDAAAYDKVIAWKRQQCRRTGVTDFLAVREYQTLLRRIYETRAGAFSGVLSVLYAGDSIAAVHLGMRSENVLHWWFPGYNRDFARYSPGSLLLVEIMRQCSQHGIGLIDLGKGDDPYKDRFKTSEIRVAEGSVMRPSLVASVRRLRIRSLVFLRSSKALAPMRRIWRRIRSRPR